MQVFLVLALLAGLALSGDVTNPPRWDANYIEKGTLKIPYSEIAEPFYACYDDNTKLLKLAPITTQQEMNKLTYVQKVEIQSILPDGNPFKLISTDTLLGFTCDKFRLDETIDQKKTVYTLWVR